MPLVKCENCGIVFKKKPSKIKRTKKHFCSKYCHLEFVSNAVLLNCEYCGKSFKRKPSNLSKSNFCSQVCAGKHVRKTNEIKLNNGYAEIYINSLVHGEKVVLIDIDSIEKVKNYNWAFHKSGYIHTTARNGSHIKIHRLIMDCPENMVVDHINHDTLDNRKENLRICTQFENMQNLKIYSSNTSKHKNISFQNGCKKWIVTVRVNKKNKTLGRYSLLDDAIKARDLFYAGKL